MSCLSLRPDFKASEPSAQIKSVGGDEVGWGVVNLSCHVDEEGEESGKGGKQHQN